MSKKRYIFIPYVIAEVGGAELYILNKSKWLIENGWEVHVLSASYTRENQQYKIKELDKYRKENMLILNRAPFECSPSVQNKVIKQMMKHVNADTEYDETIIESHTGAGSLWGELLASKINAKHIIALINESFNDISYKEKIDFFLYKKERREVFGGLHAFQGLFGGYIPISKADINMFNLQENHVNFC